MTSENTCVALELEGVKTVTEDDEREEMMVAGLSEPTDTVIPPSELPSIGIERRRTSQPWS